MKMQNKARGLIILFIAAIIWGLAFIAQRLCADYIGSFTFNSVRCLFAALFLFICLIVRKIIKKTPILPKKKKDIKNILIAGVICGFLIFCSSNFQQLGILSYEKDGASAISGRSAFITSTYCIFVAIIAFILGKKIHPLVIVAIILCMVGLFMLCLHDGLDSFYIGDLLSLGCAIGFGFYIIFVEKYSKYDHFLLLVITFAVNTILSGVVMFIVEKPTMKDISSCILPLLYAGILSNGIAYFMQAVGQKDIDAPVASIIMSLESVIAAIAGILFYNEELLLIEALGCLLMFTSVIIAQVPALAPKKISKAKK